MNQLLNHLKVLAIRVRSSRLALAVSSVAAGNFLGQIINFATVFVTGLLYSPAEYGVYATFIAIQSLAIGFCTLRLELALVIEQDLKRYGDVLSVLLGLAFSVPAVTVLLTQIYLALFSGDALVLSFVLIAPALVFGSLNVIASHILIRQERFSELSLATVTIACVTGAVVLIAGISAPSSTALIGAFVFGQFIGLVLLIIRNREVWTSGLEATSRLSTVLAISTFREVYRYPAFSFPNTLVASAYAQIPVLLISSFLSVGAAGAYSMAYRLTFQPLALIPSAVGQVFFAKLSKDRESMGRWEGPMSRVYLWSGLILATIAGSVVAFGGDVLVWVIGEQWQEAGQIMTIIIVSNVLMAIAAGYDRLYDVSFKQGTSLAIVFGATLTMIATVWIVISIFKDISAVAIGMTIVQAVFSLVWVAVVYWVSGFHWLRQCGRWALVLACALVSTTVFTGLRWVML